MHRNSLRFRLTTTFALANSLMVLLVCTGIVLLNSAHEEGIARQMLRNESVAISAQLADYGWNISRFARSPGGVRESRDIKEEIEKSQANSHPGFWGIFGGHSAFDEFSILIVDNSGKLVYKDPGDVPPPPPQVDSSWRTTVLRGNGYTIVVGVPWDDVRRRLIYEAVLLLALGLFLVALTAVGTWIIIGRALSPIAMLAGQAKAAEGSKTRVRLEPSSEDREIVQLVSMLNGLLEHLAAIAESNARFSAAASHELRTPLQGLLGHLETALSRERTNEQYVVLVKEAHSQAKRLASLVRDLLLLNRVETGSTRHFVQEFDLADVCEVQLSIVQPLLEERAVRITGDRQFGIGVSAPESHLDMLAHNLIENAAKYCSPGGTIRIDTSITDAGPRLTVHNDFPAEIKLDVARMFEPFGRPNASGVGPGEGNGLGLAICGSIAKDNGWELAISQSATGVTAQAVFSFNCEVRPADRPQGR